MKSIISILVLALTANAADYVVSFIQYSTARNGWNARILTPLQTSGPFQSESAANSNALHQATNEVNAAGIPTSSINIQPYGIFVYRTNSLPIWSWHTSEVQSP